MAEDVKEVDVKDFVKGLASFKGKTLTSVADKLGKSQSTLSGILSRKNMSLVKFRDILSILDEDFVIVTKEGQKFKIKL